MKLGEIYTTGTVVRSVGSIAPVCTRKIDEMYPETGMEFDTSILMCNGSTSEMLNKGAYGNNFTAYTQNESLQNGEHTIPIKFLGCVIIRDWDGNNPLNLTRKIVSKGDIYGATWDDVKNLRFVTNVVSSGGISESNYQSFDITTTSNIIYDFNSTYVEPSYSYNKQNLFLSSTGYVTNPLSLSGDDTKRIYNAQFIVNGSIYNKYMVDSANISKQKIGDLAFIYLINNEYFLLKSPISMPDSGYDHKAFTIDNIKNYLTIGGFSDFENGNTGFLPQNDETKGAYPYTQVLSGSRKQACNYYVTANCALYVLNSCGLRWVLTSSISTAKNFRDNVRLGVMDKNGIINHKEWITGESAIQASDNPNKDTSYDNIPDRPSSSGGDDIDEIGINDFPFNNVGGLARYYAIDRFQLDELVSDFKKSEAGIPLDAGQFVIGLYQLPIDIPSFCTSSQEKIVLGKLETNAVGKKLLTVNRRIHLGDYFISANCGNNFLDYSPYTEIKLYIPFCGMVELPPNLFINSNVSVDMIVDIISGSCKGIVMCNNTFYTSVNGSLMCSLPLSLEQCATKSLSIINSANSIISGIIFGNKNYSTLNTVTTLGEAMIENNNIAPSHISGNMDSVVNFYDPQCCILFMTYPEVNMGDISKTHGKVCNYQDTLNNCHGYTVVNNPHLEIKCTNTEKDEITKLLEQGVILP